MISALLVSAVLASPCAPLTPEDRAPVWEALADGELGEAATLLDARLARCPDDPDALLMSSRVAGILGEVDKAERQLEALIAEHPCHVDGWMWRAHRVGEEAPELAYQAMIRAIACEPDRWGSWSLLEAFQLRRGGTVFRPVVNPGAWKRTDEAAWQHHLAQADARGFGQAARYAHALAPEERGAYVRWRVEHLEEMERYLSEMVAPVPPGSQR